MERLFGTDGVRGIAGKPPLTPGMVRDIAFIAAKILLKREGRLVNGSAPTVLMGRDTRASGPGICRALVSGFAAAGCRTVDLGVVATPALSYLTPRLGSFCGVIVSASHNPAEFNGIKFFTSDGLKMGAALEERIEEELAEEGGGSVRREGLRHPASRRMASAVEDGSPWVERYAEFLKSTFPPTLDLCGLRLVVDCAHGAVWEMAPRILSELGAEVIALGCSPDGRNINRSCGAMFPSAMRRMVARRKADCGVSFDGDADRAVFADEGGVLLDGDALICMAAMRLKRLGLLRSGGVALTYMSNYGLLRFLEREGVCVVSVPVGDRNVSDAIERHQLSLGGESSGHIIFRRFSATGDGLLTALQTLAALRESGMPLSAHRRSFKPVPQVLKNLAVERRVPLESLPRLKGMIERCEKQLKGEGRIFVRYSGTEPLLRVMIEGPSRSLIGRIARDLAEAYREETVQRSSPER